MLIEFKVKNYRSFKDETILSMVASADKKSLPQNIIEPTGPFKHRLLKSAVIYGANASGKSNLIKAIEFMKTFVKESTLGDGNTKINTVPFAFDRKSARSPSEFEVDILYDGIRYVYGFSASNDKIYEEWLYHFPNGKQTILFERFLDEKKETQYKFNRAYAGRIKALRSMTRENSLFLTVATQFNVDFADKISDWFFTFHNIPTISEAPSFWTSNLIYADEKARMVVIDFLRKADLEIDDIVFEDKNSLSSMIFIHITRSLNGERVLTPIPFRDESDGTRRLFELAGHLIYALNVPLKVFSDELDLQLHPLLSEWVVEYLHMSKKKSAAQMIFTTHNTELLNPEIFRRDQIWYAEKDHPTGASRLFSLSDYKGVRNDENFRENYLGGRYGAIPILDRFEAHKS